jgi:hypothetical protein
MTDTIVDRWGGASKRTRTLGDQELTVLDGIVLPPRDEHNVRRHGGNGRPYIRVAMPDGTVLDTETTYSRCTTFIKCIDRSEALDRWHQRRAMEGFANAIDEMQALVISAQDDREKMNGVWLRALDMGGAKRLAEMGTAAHRVAEWYDLGQLPAVLPDRYQTALRGWVAATKYFRWKQIEKFMVHDGIKVAGTPDRVGEYLPCPNCGRTLYIVDLKTGRVDEYTELQQAMQFGIYANSAYYDVHTGQRTPQDDICRCRGIAIKVDILTGEYITYWVDIYTGWRIAHDLAPLVQAALKEKGLLVPFEPEPNLDALIATARDRAELRALYRRHADLWTPAHTAAGNQRLQEVEHDG